MSVGERIAEKIDEVIRGKGEIAFYYQSKAKRIEIFAYLIDQELLAAQKISGSETPIAQGLPREETGDPWIGDEDGTLHFAGHLMYLGKTIEGESKAKIIADAHNL